MLGLFNYCLSSVAVHQLTALRGLKCFAYLIRLPVTSYAMLRGGGLATGHPHSNPGANART